MIIGFISKNILQKKLKEKEDQININDKMFLNDEEGQIFLNNGENRAANPNYLKMNTFSSN